jgi:tRNA-splicing ligase RtcB (3'-phosphate/5'-hydroxy nucleic acid ligase)
MELKKINDYKWELPKHGKMLVPGVIFASEKLLEKMKGDKTLEQLQNVASLPGILTHAIACSDAHQGYGFSIGGVAAFDLEKGIISPGGVGYDINCGVRLMVTDLTYEEVAGKRKELLENLFKKIPSGVGKETTSKLTREELKEVLLKGAGWAVEKGFGTKEDLERTEEYGKIDGADPMAVSARAMKRGLAQIGTLGAGNHFLEMQKVDKIFNNKVAEAFGIKKEGQILFMIHTGSRGFGHQVASDYIKLMEEKYGFENLPDRELINAPIKSELGQKYYGAMCAAVNFAFCNRQMIAHRVREAFKEIFPNAELKQLYDVAHNIAKYEELLVDGKMTKVCIHRKGATRSFGPGRKEVPEVYREVGQPVLIPGSMGTASYVLVGTKEAEEVSFASTAHGAGRVMSRFAAMKLSTGDEVQQRLEKKDIFVKGASQRGLAEEAPEAYKDVDEVVKTSHENHIGNLVARVVPLAVMKG